MEQRVLEKCCNINKNITDSQILKENQLSFLVVCEVVW